jgi:glycosyltransferase involved in cell wall biosynthesis
MTKPLTRVIAISNFVRAQLIESGLAAEKIDVRYLGIDNQRFVPDAEAPRRLREQFAIDSNEGTLTTVSFLNPFKNPHVIIEACGLLARQGIAFRLFVAGEGALRKQLENLSRKLEIADRVHWLGQVDEPRELLQGSDIFTLASTGEAFGLVIPEAMACGLPVVATRSGGIVEIVEDPATGLLVPPLNAEALADAFKQLIQNPELKRTMGLQGQSRVAQMFTIEAVVMNTVRIYESMNLFGK